MTTQTLSQQQARKLVIMSNDFHHARKHKSSDATLKCIQHLGYVQIDTISVVNRAHLHVLWSRNHFFKEEHLDQLFESRDIFEYWSHAAAILPMCDFRYSLPRKSQFARGDIHWCKPQHQMMEYVKDTIRTHGAKRSADFKHKRSTKGQWWDWKPAKIALEQLFMQGDLMVLKREGFQKIYDLTQQVLTKDVITDKPTDVQLCQYLITSYLRSQGLGALENFIYLRKGLKVTAQRCLEHMHEEGMLQKVKVNDTEYFALPESLSLLNRRLSRKVHILSPFDNLVIQRKRINELFDFDYQIECYVPENKRKFGYFCLPILYGDQLVGRIDCKAHRKQGILQVKSVFQEKPIRDVKHFQYQLKTALDDFAAFNRCEEISVSL